ncbi:MAG: hypothetical protein ACR2PT_00280 [Endozoicomonas sp.]
MLWELLRHAFYLPNKYDERGADGWLINVILDQVNLTPSACIRLPRPGDDKPR